MTMQDTQTITSDNVAAIETVTPDKYDTVIVRTFLPSATVSKGGKYLAYTLAHPTRIEVIDDGGVARKVSTEPVDSLPFVNITNLRRTFGKVPYGLMVTVRAMTQAEATKAALGPAKEPRKASAELLGK